MTKIYAGLVEGKPYIIGREGHIYINDRHASRRHAVIRLYRGKITLRDLGSENGTYIYKSRKFVPFTSGFVKEDDRLIIGGDRYYVYELLERISLAPLRRSSKSFTSPHDPTDLLITGEQSARQ